MAAFSPEALFHSREIEVTALVDFAAVATDGLVDTIGAVSVFTEAAGGGSTGTHAKKKGEERHIKKIVCLFSKNILQFIRPQFCQTPEESAVPIYDLSL